MTYEELLKQLQELTDKQLLCDCVVHLLGIDEYLPIGGISFATDVSVLDEDHPILIIED